MAIEHWLRLAMTDGIGPILIRRTIEAAGDAALCRRGLVLALDACHQSLVLREVEAALSHLRCAERLLQLLDTSP